MKFAIAFASIGLCYCQSNRGELELFGFEEDSYELEYSKSVFAGFGEGYSFEIYILSDSLVQSIIASPQNNLPAKSNSQDLFISYGWNTWPIGSQYDEVLDISLNYYTRNEGLKKAINSAKAMIANDSPLVAFYAYPNLPNPKIVQLFVLDTISRRMYFVDSRL